MSGKNCQPSLYFSAGETGDPAPAVPTRTCYKCWFVLVALEKTHCPRCRANLDAAERSARQLSAFRTGKMYLGRGGARVR